MFSGWARFLVRNGKWWRSSVRWGRHHRRSGRSTIRGWSRRHEWWGAGQGGGIARRFAVFAFGPKKYGIQISVAELRLQRQLATAVFTQIEPIRTIPNFKNASSLFRVSKAMNATSEPVDTDCSGPTRRAHETRLRGYSPSKCFECRMRSHGYIAFGCTLGWPESGR